MKHGKKYTDALKKFDSTQAYDVEKACQIVKDVHFAKFDETVELHVALKLGKSQTVRDTLVFPNQFTAEKKVLVFCPEERAKEALDAGAAYDERCWSSWYGFGPQRSHAKPKNRHCNK